MTSVKCFNPDIRLQTKDGICEFLGGISHAAYDRWRVLGVVPGPLAGTSRYDVQAHHRALDRCSGITKEQSRHASPLEQWEATSEN